MKKKSKVICCFEFLKPLKSLEFFTIFFLSRFRFC